MLDPNHLMATPMQITSTTLSDDGPKWAPDNAHIIFSRLSGSGLDPTQMVYVDDDGTNPVFLTGGTVRDISIDWGTHAGPGTAGGLNDCAYESTIMHQGRPNTASRLVDTYTEK